MWHFFDDNDPVMTRVDYHKCPVNHWVIDAHSMVNGIEHDTRDDPNKAGYRFC